MRENVNFHGPIRESDVRLFSIPRSAKRLVPLLCLLLAASEARACSVPVFRYALEQWRSDPYQVLFFHRGPLSPEHQALLDRLSPEGKAGEISANVTVIPVDLDALSPTDPQGKEDLALWKSQNTETLPWLVMRYPLSIPIAKTIWAGEATEESIDHLLDSPKRREIARRILKGDTAVWVLLESGNQEADAAAYLTLENELKFAEKSLQLPAADPQDVADGLISVDQAALKIRFSILKVSKKDPQEARFVEMLLDSEPEYPDLPSLRSEIEKGKPIAFPIFGRGRALYALVGDGIVKNEISAACKSLTGPCTCQIKQRNPGTDLLLAADWEHLVTSKIPVDESLPPLPVFAPVSASVTKDAPPQAKPDSEKTQTETDKGKPAPAEKPISATSKAADETPKAAGSRVVITTVLSLLVAAMGIGVASFFFMKS